MLTTKIELATVTGDIVSVDLMPRLIDWRKADVAKPELAFRVKIDIPVPTSTPGMSEIVRGTVWIPTRVREDGSVATLGIESGTALMPKGDRSAAKLQYDPTTGQVLLKDGLPVLAATEDPKTSHWAACRFVPCRARSFINLTKVALEPRRISEGPRKGAYAYAGETGEGPQCVKVSAADWSVGVGKMKEADGEAGSNGFAEHGCRQPAWLAEAEAAE